MPPLSQSVRGVSRRWSKYCMFSRSSGLISASMKASISPSSPGRCSGRLKSTTILLSTSRRVRGCLRIYSHFAYNNRALGDQLEPVQRLLPNPRQRGDRVLVADLEPEPGCADEDGGEVLEQQRDRRRRVFGI